MSSKPWEGRSVWAQVAEQNEKGWVEIRERDSKVLELIVCQDQRFTASVCMTREQAKTFAAQIMNLAQRDRS